jgi:hypothetical protein
LVPFIICLLHFVCLRQLSMAGNNLNNHPELKN